ncbi:hypothetical protein WJ29_25290 [Burkholderia ubonensis]|nr:hypothetical protein WJ29_25290 [Burkholderia ubonensis]
MLVDRSSMSTIQEIVLFVLFVSSAAVLLLNVAHTPWMFDYWNLDNEIEEEPSKLDFLCNQLAFYTAAVVLAATASYYFWLTR